MCGKDYAGKRVRDYNFADLPSFQKSIPMHTAVGEYELKDHEQGRFSLLRDLFEKCDGIYISIDLKDSSPEMVSKVEAMIKEFKREEFTFWGSMFAD